MQMKLIFANQTTGIRCYKDPLGNAGSLRKSVVYPMSQSAYGACSRQKHIG